MTTIRSLVVVMVSAMAACSGDTGPTGPGGPTGPQGPIGPEGPLAAPPVLSSLSPSWGSGNTQVTILGQNFSTTAADNQVYFDGYPATVVSATATELVVTAGVASDEGETPMVVSVEVANQVSNGLFFTLVPTGTAGRLDLAMMMAPGAMVEVGGDLYIAAGLSNGPASQAAGLYRMDSTDQVSRVFAADSIDVSDGSGGTFELMDGPVALASDGIDVLFVTALGAVRRYQVASGEINEILGPNLGGGSAFPGRTGLATTDDGVIYVVDRNHDQGGNNFGGIVAVDPGDWSVWVIADPLFDGNGSSAPGIYGIATDGTNLWVTNEYWGEVYRVTDPTGARTVNLVADGAYELRGIGLIDDDGVGGLDTVVVSESPPPGDPPDPSLLLSADMAASGAVLANWGVVDGYLYPASALATTAAGDLLLAQPDGGVVRSIAAGGTESTIIAAGLRPTFGAGRDGTTWYLATFGPALFGGDPSAGQPDAAVVQVTATGATRVLATGALFTGLVVTGVDQMDVSDCLDQRIFALDASDGGQTDVVDASDGLACPGGLAMNAGGDLFYANVNLFGGDPTTIGRLTAASSNNPAFATGLQPGALFLALAGNTLVSTGFGGAPFAIESASATTAGAGSELIPRATAGQVGLAGDGARAFAFRFGLGAILEVDIAAGELLPYGSALAPGAVLGPGGGSFAFTAAFGADGTMVIPDFGQGAMIAVTP